MDPKYTRILVEEIGEKLLNWTGSQYHIYRTIHSFEGG